jgi:hypothetical protein
MNEASSTNTTSDKRNLLSSVFIGLLLALAYQEMVPPARDSFRSQGLTVPLLVLLSVFFLTTMRFFIGAILHLVSDSLVKLAGGHWFFDFMTITLEMTVIVFLGGLTSVEANRAAKLDFFVLLTALYAIDVIWIVAQWLLGKIRRRWSRPFIPAGWAYLNTGLIAAMALTRLAYPDQFALPAIAILGVLNVAAFVIDVILIDHYRVLRPEKQQG